ncbi:xanthine dehydrogenase family protein subunit M [Bacteroidetes/Chlorobi group bacterium ChocPot_Mid]|nr:MAG: xanthine dehydrogenase family protein subunit M [Bacteroidetes/Chlorobi group bacterium ChocPot_Mid]
MFIPELKYFKPETLDEVYRLLKSKENSAVLAGGTDILVEMKQGIRSLNNIISLNKIISLKNIDTTTDSVIIGSCATHNQIAESNIIKKYLPALANAVLTIGTHQIRNTATIGGNLCTCASCADSAPILIIYDALLEIGSDSGKRIVKATDFFVGHHINALQKGELLLNIIVPKPAEHFGAHFEKFGLRESASISVASVAAGILLENEIIKEANVVIGACAPIPMKSEQAISVLLNRNITDLTKDSELLKEVGEAAAQEVLPIDDIRASAEYRRNIVNVLTQRVVLKALSKINNIIKG